MKNILLCDGLSIAKTSQLCRQLKLGIEVQTFCVPELYAENNPEGLSQVRQEVEGIAFASMHGPYRDLNTGSADYLIRDITRQRYQQAYNLATELNVTNMILHNGYARKNKRYSEWTNILFYSGVISYQINTIFHFYLKM